VEDRLGDKGATSGEAEEGRARREAGQHCKDKASGSHVCPALSRDGSAIGRHI
jgi:hypothetical protein